MTCPDCGSPMPSGAVACSDCGASMASNYPMGSFSDAWRIITSSPGDFIAATIVMSATSGVVGYITSEFTNVPAQLVANVLCEMSDAAVPAALGIILFSVLFNFLFNIMILAPIYCGYSNFILKKVRGENPSFNVVFSGYTQFLLPSALTGLVLSLASGLGWMLCLIPGLIIGALCMFVYYIVVDGETNVAAVFSRSASLFSQNFFINFIFYILAGLVGISGILACCVGTIFTIPLSYIAIALVYNHLSGGGSSYSGAASSSMDSDADSPSAEEFNF